jgi:DNA invertase Pin-like site-specific DNA recombinase
MWSSTTSRLNRNRVDDAQVLMLMRSLKVTLISAQENIDKTPAMRQRSRCATA